MGNINVDVAGAMREIRRQNMPGEAPGGMAEQPLEATVAQSAELAGLAEAVQNARGQMAPHCDVGAQLPAFARFPAPVRGLLTLFARVARKCARFITAPQTVVNHSADNAFAALAESDAVLLRALQDAREDAAQLRSQLETLEKHAIPFAQLYQLSVQNAELAAQVAALQEQVGRLQGAGPAKATGEENA